MAAGENQSHIGQSVPLGDELGSSACMDLQNNEWRQRTVKYAATNTLAYAKMSLFMGVL